MLCEYISSAWVNASGVDVSKPLMIPKLIFDSLLNWVLQLGHEDFS